MLNDGKKMPLKDVIDRLWRAGGTSNPHIHLCLAQIEEGHDVTTSLVEALCSLTKSYEDVSDRLVIERLKKPKNG